MPCKNGGPPDQISERWLIPQSDIRTDEKSENRKMPGELLHTQELQATAALEHRDSDEKSLELHEPAHEAQDEVQDGVAQVEAITQSWSKRSLIIVYAT